MYIKNFNSIYLQPPPIFIGGFFDNLVELTKDKKMNCYEHTFITKQDLGEGQNSKALSKYQEIIKKNSGKIIKTEEWGLRGFANQIKKNKKGFYFHIKFEGDGSAVKELEKAHNIDDMIIRSLTVKVKKHDLENNFFEKKDI